MSNMTNIATTIAEVEHAAMQAWPGLEVQLLNGWRLRHSQGVTRRANSVWPNGQLTPGTLAQRLAAVEAFYVARNLPARYQICPIAQPPELDAVLAEHSYASVATTAVQVGDTATARAGLPVEMAWEMSLSPTVTPAWLMAYGLGEGIRASELPGRQAIMDTIIAPARYALALRHGEPVAVGSAVVQGDWVGLFNIATLPQWRRQGAAQAILRTLLAWGLAQGASRTYLQVMASNAPALALYARLGYTTLYTYHYREQTRLLA